MKPVLYARVSSAAQEERGTIKTQQDVADRWCLLNKVSLAESYLDDGVSGAIPFRDRPAASRLLTAARNCEFDTILIYSLSRLGRDTRDVLATLDLFQECGVAIQSLTENFTIESTPMGRFVTTQLAALNQLMRDNIRSDSRRGMERAAREGRWTGGRAPFGYRVLEGRLAIDPEQGEVVRNVFTWYLCGQRVRGIALKLNAAGIKHPQDWNKPISRPWYEATVSGVLNNRSYVGEWQWRKRTDRREVHGKTTFTVTTPEQRIAVAIPPLVSIEDFDRVKQTLKDNFLFSKRNVKHFYLLRGLIFCGWCGRRYLGLASGRKPWLKNYYRCSSHIGAVGRVPCEGRAVRADLIDAGVWEQVSEFITNPASVFEELRMTMEMRQSSQHDLRSEVSQMDSALLVKGRERARVINLIRRAFISDNEGERELATLQREVDQIERQRSELQSRLAASESSELRALTAESMLGLLADKVSNMSDDTKREVALVLVDRITIETEKGRPLARVCYVFRSVVPSNEAVDSVEVGLPHPTQIPALLTVTKSLVF
jgi:site-specific DNA recombinase